VLRESTQDEEDAVFLRQTVFERLNTGGIELEAQEIRNCLFQGPFNDLLVELTKQTDFRDAFGLPRFSPDEVEPNAAIKKHIMYQKLEDAELILRFFALRHAENYTRGMHGFLDLYMNRAKKFSKSDIEYLHELFIKTITLARKIYGDFVFKVYSPKENEWAAKSHKAFYDAVMVGLSNHLDNSEKLLSKSAEIIESTKQLFISKPDGTFTGRGNTKADIKDRISLFENMLDTIILQ
jgi:hypothetical protein